jgi:putative transposase
MIPIEGKRHEAEFLTLLQQPPTDPAVNVLLYSSPLIPGKLSYRTPGKKRPYRLLCKTYQLLGSPQLLYLVAILDWYSRYVLSWELEQTLELPFVLTAVQQALGQTVPLICTSDQGSHVTSPPYCQLLQAANVRISMDGKGRALDNIVTERVWRTGKYEEVYIPDSASPRETRQALTRSFALYTQERPHQALDYQTPAEVYVHETSAGQRQNE